MTGQKLKRLSLISLIAATALLLIDFIHVKTAMLDFLPQFFVESMFIAYPTLLFASLILYIASRAVKTSTDGRQKLLFVFNGLAVLAFFIFNLME